MKRGRLFFIGLLSAIITIISLNLALGSRWNGYRNYYHNGYHHCYNKNDDHNYDKEDHRQPQSKADSSNSNY